MALYAIGDIQGCFNELQGLLDQINYNPHQDRLWFAGDLVNRGPESLAVLRFVRALGEAAVTVLGNHDLHLLAAAVYPERYLRKKDTLTPVLEAPDRTELLDWLRDENRAIGPQGRIGFAVSAPMTAPLKQAILDTPPNGGGPTATMRRRS